MRIQGLLAVAACAATLLAGQAAASTRYVVFRGVIDSGFDDAGVFGTAGDLTGKSYVMVYGFDLSRGVNRTNFYSQELIDGFSLGQPEPNPIVEVRVGVDGHYVDPFGAPARYGAAATYDAYDLFGFAGVAAHFGSGAGDTTNTFSNVVYTFTAPTRLNVDYFGRSAGYYPGGPLGNAEQHDGAGFAYAFAMRPDTVRITGDLQSAIPEPAAWGLMVAGFGAAGAVLRRRWGREAAAGLNRGRAVPISASFRL